MGAETMTDAEFEKALDKWAQMEIGNRQDGEDCAKDGARWARSYTQKEMQGEIERLKAYVYRHETTSCNQFMREERDKALSRIDELEKALRKIDLIKIAEGGADDFEDSLYETCHAMKTIASEALSAFHARFGGEGE